MQRLSLLARGTPKIVAPVEMVWRFIPAGAGNTSLVLSDGYCRPVYPRWRGEHSPERIR
ncbi:protease inhibitor I42 family protein [Salmonella enterica]|nr:protease inhibitor I42 family protein [Salmonella enterica]EGG2175823.1 protease inhibitor I42 family protein [Salmonella enterica]